MEKHVDSAAEKGSLRAKVRKFVIMIVMVLVWLLKPLKFLHKFYPYKIRELSRAWDTKMIWTFVLSGGKRLIMDQNCIMRDPPSFKPLIQTKPEYQFTEDQIKQFYRDGFLGPITLWTPEEMVEVRRRVDSVLERQSAVYPQAENQLRDRYIDAPEFWEVISQEPLVERLAQLLGPDMLVWRSQIFNKKAGGPEVTWHQASTYMGEQRFKATLEPKDRNELFQLTTWIAIDDAFFGNGCMHFLKGTHRKMWSRLQGGSGYVGNPPEVAKLIGGYGRFAKSAGITMEVPITDEMIVPMPLKSGQCVIFTERCIHGSPPNVSDKRRFGFVFRAIKPNVQVYREETVHEVTYLHETYNLQNWGCAVLRGEDKFKLNRLITPPVYKQAEKAASAGAVNS